MALVSSFLPAPAAAPNRKGQPVTDSLESLNSAMNRLKDGDDFAEPTVSASPTPPAPAPSSFWKQAGEDVSWFFGEVWDRAFNPQRAQPYQRIWTPNDPEFQPTPVRE